MQKKAIRIWNRNYLTIAVAAIMVIAFAFMNPLYAADKVVRIGNIIPLSGPSATVGKQGKQAREMAVEEINAGGGIKSLGGAKLELIYADSESKPDKGVAEAERLINTEKVHVLTGCWNSAVTYPTTAISERYGIHSLCLCPLPTKSQSKVLKRYSE